MATLNESDFNDDAKRDLPGAFAGMKATLPGLKAVRRPTALVVEILRKSNNFFATGAEGLKAIEIEDAIILVPEIEGKQNPRFNPSKIANTVPRIAEVAALLCCTDNQLDECDEDPKASMRLARKIMRNKTTQEIIELLPAIQNEFDKINRSSAIVPENETDEPASIIDLGKKKQVTHGSQAMS